MPIFEYHATLWAVYGSNSHVARPSDLSGFGLPNPDSRYYRHLNGRLSNMNHETIAPSDFAGC